MNARLSSKLEISHKVDIILKKMTLLYLNSCCLVNGNKMSLLLRLLSNYFTSTSKALLIFFIFKKSGFVVPILLQAFRKFNEASVVELVDPLMDEAVNAEVLMKMFDLAFQCAAPIRTDRPDMKSVGEQLWTIRAEHLKSAQRG